MAIAEKRVGRDPFLVPTQGLLKQGQSLNVVIEEKSRKKGRKVFVRACFLLTFAEGIRQIHTEPK